MLVKYIIKVFLYLILAVMTLIHWLLKIPMILGNILLYFLSIIFILTGVLSYGFALDNNWDGIWCNTRLCPIFGKKFRDIGCKTVEYDK
jgi:hypothetical protein